MKLIKIQACKMNSNKIALADEIVSVSDSYFFKAYEVFKNIIITDGEFIEGIIKVALTEMNGLEELLEGVTFNNEKYLPIIVSPSGLKKEDNEGDIKHKTEVLFINEIDKDFIEELEDSLSAGKIKQFLNEGKELCTNKDITSRVALAVSGADVVNYMPSICFVDEVTYSYASNYHYEDENNKLTKEHKKLEFTFNDGGGLMSNKMSKIIKEQLKLDYKIDFAVFRFYHGFACKGVVLRFNFARYMKENYTYDTATFKKENNKYFIKDIFGAWRNIDEIDMILNSSQVKWLKNWKNDIAEGQRWEEVINPLYDNSKYKDINKCIYVTKVNKDPKELKPYITLNYQVLQNLNVVNEELEEIVQPIVDQYKKLIKLDDVNMVKIALGDYITDEENESISNKTSIILDKLGDEALKMQYIKRILKNQFEKRLKELAGGKIPVWGGVKMGVADPITYCNYLMTGQAGNNGLGLNEFYIAGEIGVRLSYRNPVAYYAEVTKINLVDKLNYWLKNYTSEILFVNAHDDFLMIKSGADLDGDIFGVVNNEILINSIIEEEAPFINIKDGETVKSVFTREQMLTDAWSSAGNLIGKIAITSGKLSAECTSLNNYAKDGEVYTYTEIKERFLKTIRRYSTKEEFFVNERLWDKKEFSYINVNPDLTWDEYDEYRHQRWQEYNEKNNLLFNDYFKGASFKKIGEFEINDRKKLIKSMFIKNKKKFFAILYASQLAIDKPKTLKDIPVHLKRRLSNINKRLYKPRFMHYLGKCKCKGRGKMSNCSDIIKFNSQNIMDKYSSYIYKELISPLVKLTIKEENNDGDKMISKFENMRKEVDELSKLISDTEGKLNNELLEIYTEYYHKRNMISKENLKDKIEQLNKVDLDTLKKIEAIELKQEDIRVTLKEAKATVRFMMNFFWDYMYDNLMKLPTISDTIIEAEDGEYLWNFNRYKAEKRDKRYLNISKDDKLKLLEKDSEIIKIRFHGVDDYEMVQVPRVITIIDKKCKELGVMWAGEKDKTVADGTYSVYDFKVDNTKKGISIWLNLIDKIDG